MNIKELRLKKGLKQWELALKVGVSLTTIQTWEKGISKPSPENEKKLKEVLGIE